MKADGKREITKPNQTQPMSYQRKTLRSYTYRVDIDDRRAMRKIHRLQALDSGYDITEVPDREIPNKNAVKNWGYKYYRSKEMRDFETGNKTGGTIPGLGEYEYSLEWEAFPNDEKLEMRNANGGGTRIKGYQYMGTSDPRLPDNVPVDTVVSWTPTEIKAIFDGEPVPDKMNYTYDHPEIEASEAREMLRDHIRMAKRDGADKNREKLQEYVANCDHDHVVTTDSKYQPAFCEDCGRDWDRHGFEYAQENNEITVVGSV